jgi:hypothetical protein
LLGLARFGPWADTNNFGAVGGSGACPVRFWVVGSRSEWSLAQAGSPGETGQKNQCKVSRLHEGGPGLGLDGVDDTISP